ALAERARVAARHAPGHLVAGPGLERGAGRVVDQHLHLLLVLLVEPADLPAARPAHVAVGAPLAGMLLQLLLHLHHALGGGDRLLGVHPVALRHLGLRVGQHHGGVRRGGCGKRKGRERGRDERENQEASAQRPWPKLHILFPRKFSGIAAAIEIACAATFGTPRPLMSSSSIASENRNASTLTTKKRTAWKPA